MRLFTNEKERKSRLEVCKVCPHYRDTFTFLWIFKFKKVAQCNDCGCPISNRIELLNPHCDKHDQL